jgi:hypothetical protein
MSTAIVYRTPPQSEHKAAQELREAGIRAYVPRDRGSRRSPFTGKHLSPCPGYVFARGALASAYAKHVRAPLGIVDKSELHRLYIGRPKRRATEALPYTIGQTVRIGEVTGTVRDIRGRHCIVETVMFGKHHSQAIHYTQLRPG